MDIGAHIKENRSKNAFDGSAANTYDDAGLQASDSAEDLLFGGDISWI
jgi:hypothetical protein